MLSLQHFDPTSHRRRKSTSLNKRRLIVEQLENRRLLAVYNVNTVNDVIDAADTFLSLREAVVAANANSGDDQINLPAGTYTLTLDGSGEDLSATGDLDVTDASGTLTILGVGAAASVIDASGLTTPDRVIDVLVGAGLNLDSVTITGGDAGGDEGGGIRSLGTTELTRSVVTGNTSERGGGIYLKNGVLTLSRSEVSNNQAINYGGGIFTRELSGFSTISITNTTISNNAASLSGGGISHRDGEMTLSESTLTGNSANIGGGITSDDSILISNSTISGNTAFGSGGGIFRVSRGFAIENSTVTNNVANLAGGILNHGPSGSGFVTSTIVAGNIANNDNDLNSGFASGGNNVIGDDSGSTGFVDGVNGDQVGSGASPLDPLLGPLQNNGGPTQTHALLPGSPAIDAGSNSAGHTQDQRRYSRVAGSGIDVGAYERLACGTIVMNTNDSGLDSLRAAITCSNTLPGTDTISFDIDRGVQSIQPLTALPVISDSTVIDGTTQPGFAGTPLIEISGALAGPGVSGLDITAGNSTVRSLAINGWASNGIELSTNSNNVITGNFIGTDVSGLAGLGNGGHGIQAASTGTNRIGGPNAESNLIAFNFGDGVAVLNDATGIQITNNSIHSNAGLGIDLSADGVTLNDPGDGDSGANDLQNFPVITSAESVAGTTTVIGTLNSTPNTTFTLEFFSSDAADPSGFGEGQTWLGSTVVATDASGNASFNLAIAVAVASGNVVTATATNPANSTSEFSVAAVVNSQPSVTVDNLIETVFEGVTAVNKGTFSDVDAGDIVIITASIGTITQDTGNNGNWNWSLDTTDGPDESQMVTITATDSLGASNQVMFELTVSNVPPTLNVSVTFVEEGMPTSVIVQGINEPGDDTITEFIVDWGDGNTESFFTAGPFVHVYDDGPLMPNIRIDTVDEDGTHIFSGFITQTIFNADPTANDDAANVGENGPSITIDVLANDTDPAGVFDPLSVISFDATGTIGLLIDNGDGTFDYDSNGQFDSLATGQSATDTFTYTIDDGDGGSDTATVTITIDGISDQTPPEQVQDVADDIQDIIDATPGAQKKLDGAVKKLEDAVDELNETPPDNDKALKKIKDAIKKIEDAVDKGEIDPTTANLIMDTLVGIARGIVVDAIDLAITVGGDPSDIADAQDHLSNGDVARTIPNFQDALNEYIDAVKDAESALPLAATNQGSASDASLSHDLLDPIVEQAIALWSAAGIDADRIRALRSIDVHIEDLPDQFLGFGSPTAIWIDNDAAGHQWNFRSNTPAAKQFDLLTVVAHELGHALGIDHDDHGLMAAALTPGIRLLPESDEAVVATLPAISPDPFSARQFTNGQALLLESLPHETLPHETLPPGTGDDLHDRALSSVLADATTWPLLKTKETDSQSLAERFPTKATSDSAHDGYFTVLDVSEIDAANIDATF